MSIKYNILEKKSYEYIPEKYISSITKQYLINIKTFIPIK